MSHYVTGLGPQAVDAIEQAAQLALGPDEYDAAVAETIALFEMEATADEVVTTIEKVVGLGLDEEQFGAACGALERFMAQHAALPERSEDSHLEAEYESRFEAGLEY